jgi:hypothetical protein
MTCPKCEQLFSKSNFVIAKKLWRTTAVNCCARNRYRTKAPTQPPYQNQPTFNFNQVEREVLVYECIHNRVTLKLSQYSLKNACLAICLKVVLRIPRALYLMLPGTTGDSSTRITADKSLVGIFWHWRSTRYSSTPVQRRCATDPVLLPNIDIIRTTYSSVAGTT